MYSVGFRDVDDVRNVTNYGTYLHLSCSFKYCQSRRHN